MLRATMRSLLARKLRLVMSGFAIVLGVAFVAGSFVFTDTLGHSFDSLIKGGTSDVVVNIKGEGDLTSGAATADSRTISAATVARIRRVAGVARVDGNTTIGNVFLVGKNGKLVGGNGPPSFVVNYTTAPSITGKQTLKIVKGHVPHGIGQIALDEDSASSAGYTIGDTVSLVSVGAQPRLQEKLVGLSRFGGGSLIGATMTVFDTRAAQQLFLGGKDVYTDLSVTAAPGVSQTTLRNRIAEVLPPGVIAKTGDAEAKQNKDSVASALTFINTLLLVFAGVALVVGSFLIINTFSILVAQRSRELALLRALGASRRQVTRSVMVEAFVVGLIASTIGLGLGFVLALGLKALFSLIGLKLGAAPLVFEPRTAIVSYVVGLLVTMFAAYLPARRASRIAPIEALRDDIALPESSLRRRVGVGVVLVGIGAALMTVGLLGSGGRGASFVGGGVLAVLIGVALLSPVLGRPVLLGLGAVYRRMFGAIGVLAEQNSLRNPRRTAATASALMIGLALVSAMSVLGSSTNASIDKLVSEDLTAQYVISNVVGVPFSPSIAAQVSRLPGVKQVAPVRALETKIDGHTEFLSATDTGAYANMVKLDAVHGNLTDVTGRRIAMTVGAAKKLGVSLGQQVSVKFPAGSERLTLAMTYKSSQVAYDYIVSLSALDVAKVKPADQTVFVTTTSGSSQTAVSRGINKVIAGLPTVTLKNQQQFKDQQKQSVNQLLYLIYALLGLAIVIAVLGIVNTLALSVIERTREVGLLRAVGMSRRQLRRMIRLEAVAIAVLGALLGVVMGIVFGVVLQHALSDQGINVLSIPIVRLVIFVVVSALVGVLAALLPARRAARLDVLAAITTE